MKIALRFLVVAFAVLAVSSVNAADTPKKAPAKDAPAKKEAAKKAANGDTLPFYGKVVSITSRTLTLVRSDAADAPEVKFAVNASTEYVNGDKPSSIDAVKPGAWVGGAAKKAAEGNDVIVKLNVGVKQKAKGKAPAKGKGKTEPAKKKSE
ncbi:MAG: hypothetical protein JNN17_25705 [Verrucomicrobiaceae bacterium]|nr:hypothetical protein [Verrucomicrobiaceae bacterium]